MDKVGVRMDKGPQPIISTEVESPHGVHRRRRRKHHDRSKAQPRGKGRGVEITVVTLLALAILFVTLYLLLAREPRGEESTLRPARPGPSVVLFPHQVQRAGAHVAVLTVESPA